MNNIFHLGNPVYLVKRQHTKGRLFCNAKKCFAFVRFNKEIWIALRLLGRQTVHPGK